MTHFIPNTIWILLSKVFQDRTLWHNFRGVHPHTTPFVSISLDFVSCCFLFAYHAHHLCFLFVYHVPSDSFLFLHFTVNVVCFFLLDPAIGFQPFDFAATYLWVMSNASHLQPWKPLRISSQHGRRTAHSSASAEIGMPRWAQQCSSRRNVGLHRAAPTEPATGSHSKSSMPHPPPPTTTLFHPSPQALSY